MGGVGVVGKGEMRVSIARGVGVFIAGKGEEGVRVWSVKTGLGGEGRIDAEDEGGVEE